VKRCFSTGHRPIKIRHFYQAGDKYIYPAMTAFTDQYSLPNIFFDIGQL
jgi:hypothetical protein